jgi:GNAT superfamily N-acetyltransferase
MAVTPGRLSRAVERHGACGVARIASTRARRRFSAEEAHVWYSLDLGADRPRRELPEGLVLRRATESDLRAIEALPGAEPVHALRRGLTAGHELWIVDDGERTAFCCWIHLGVAPVLAARHGSLVLPAGVVCLEDSVTSPEFRGRGIAPAAWAAIGDRFELAGYSAVVTKVETDNQPSRRAVEKAGFREIATMRLARRGLMTRVTVVPGEGALGVELAGRLG